jgi:hypothetical protein
MPISLPLLPSKINIIPIYTIIYRTSHARGQVETQDFEAFKKFNTEARKLVASKFIK